MLDEGMHVVVGEIIPEWELARDLMSPYSDLVWGGENVPELSNCPVVDEIGDESMLLSLQTEAAERWGATRAILGSTFRIKSQVVGRDDHERV